MTNARRELARTLRAPPGGGIGPGLGTSGAGLPEPRCGHAGSRRTTTRRLVGIAIAVAVIAILLISAVPIAAVTSPAARPSTAPTSPAESSPGAAPAAPAAAPGPIDRAALCLLGTDPSCLPTGAPTSDPVPAATGSSWTNVTPRSGSPNPPGRFLPSMTYFPDGHEDVLFGGYGELGSGPWNFYQDTWTFTDGVWSEAISNSSCTSTTCPSPRAGAMMTYYPPDDAVLLFGGYVYSPSITYIPFNDTWLFYDGTWHNISSTAGAAPSPRFEGSMVWDSLDDYALLFGGSTATGASLGDTWSFNGTWHNISAEVGSEVPTRRAGAAISNSPSGYIMLYGGETNGVVISDTSQCGYSLVAYWFYHGNWSEMPIQYACIYVPRAAPSVNGTFPPCGRVEAALGWSPPNNRFVLFGGIGPEIESSCSGFQGFLNDTWTYVNPPGAGFNWGNETIGNPQPAARYEMASASDFSYRYFVIFGGWDGSGGGLADTWRYFALVGAKLTGPSNIDTSGNPSFLLPFTTTGFGGSGNLDYWFSIQGLKTGNSLSGTGCTNLTDRTNTTLPYDGTDAVTCEATAASYNVYRLTVHVWDVDDSTDQATANWTFTVSPPEIFAIYSQYSGYFYSQLSFPDKLGFLAIVAGAPANSVNVTIDGVVYYLNPRSGAPDWWDLSINIQDLSPGPNVVSALAAFGENWTLNASYTINVIRTPDWLADIFIFPTVTQKITSKGAGPYNETYSISESWSWSLDKALAFALPIPLATGNYSLVPGLQVALVATSSGNISLTGGLSLAPPKISLGPVNLQLTAVVSLKGSFTLSTSSGGDVEGINWVSAVAQISVVGKFSGSVPIYGFSVLGVSIGFTLEVEVDPSISLDLLLAPTTPGFDEFISGIAIKIDHFFGSFSLPLTVAVKFSIGFASVELGGTISVALEFISNTGLSIADGWVNGSIFVKASALFWSDTWNLLSGTIYHWTDPPSGDASVMPDVALPGYDNGTNTTWVPQERYYATPGYDSNVWNSTSTEGTAVSDIYPNTEVTAVASSSGTYLFYSNDDVEQSVQDGLEVSGLDLSGTSNSLGGVPAPADPGFEISSPQATRLPDGDLYVLWNALPMAETTLGGPIDLTRLDVHGATYDPTTGVWGAVRDWTTWGLAESFLVDATGGTPEIGVLVSHSFLVGSTTPEQLVVYDLTSGAEIDNASVTGQATLVALRGAVGQGVFREADGNYTTVALGSGVTTPPAFASPIGGSLVSATYAIGSTSTLVLLYRGANGSLLSLYEPGSATTLATLSVGPDAFDAQAIADGATFYVFLRTSNGIQGWTESGGAFLNLTTITEAGVESYAPVQLASGILIYSLTETGNSSAPTVDLDFAEIGANIAPVPSAGPASTPAGGVSNATALLYLVVAAAGVALLLSVIWIRTRRRAPGSPPAGAAGSRLPEPEPAAEGASPPPDTPRGAD